MARVALVGLGAMGSGVAGRRWGAGHDLVVHNRTAEKAAEPWPSAPVTVTAGRAVQESRRTAEADRMATLLLTPGGPLHLDSCNAVIASSCPGPLLLATGAPFPLIT